MSLRKWLLRFSLFMCLVSLLSLAGCSGSSSSKENPPPANISITGAITFPAGSGLAKSAAATTDPITVEVRRLDGTLVGQATVTPTGTGSYSYNITGLSRADYTIVAARGSELLKGLVDEGRLSTTTVQDINGVSTTSVILAEQKLGVPPGTIGSAANALVTSSAVASVNPTALENAVNTAVNTVLFAPQNATEANVALANLASLVNAAVSSGVDAFQLTAGTGGATVTAVLYTLTGTGAEALPAETIDAPAASTTLTQAGTAYTPPPANSVSFTSKAFDYTGSPAGTPVAGVIVTTVGLTNAVSTTTDASGSFSLVGIPQGATFHLKLSKASYADSYSGNFTLTESVDSSDRPYAMAPPTSLTNLGNTAGNGVIRTRVVTSTDQVNGYLGNAVVTATDQQSGATYPVRYFETSGALSNTLTATNPDNGQFAVVNIPAGRTVVVTASRVGYNFTPKTFPVHADSWSQGRIVGTAASSGQSHPIAVALDAGIFAPDSDSDNTGVFYSYERIFLAGSAVSFAERFYSNGSWGSTPPLVEQPDYHLTANGWTPESSADEPIVFNADGSATVTDSTDGSTAKLVFNTIAISGRTIASVFGANFDWPVLNNGQGVFPAGSVAYDVVFTPLTDSYSLWYSTGLTSTDTTSLSNLQVFIDADSEVTEYYATFNSDTTVTLWSRNPGGAPTPIGNTIALRKTLSGQDILEIIIPSNLRNQYRLAGNPILSMVNGVVWIGSHPVPNVVDYDGGGRVLNQTAFDFLLTQFNGSAP